MHTVTFLGRFQASCHLDQEQTLLVAAGRAEIPLAHRCGGHARCGTCKVTIVEGQANLHPPGQAEQRILKVLKLPEDRRLACQCWVKGDVTCRID